MQQNLYLTLICITYTKTIFAAVIYIEYICKDW